MAMKVRMQGKAGNYRFRGAVWELGSFAYRAYVHLIPVRFRPDLSRSVLSADGMTMQEVLAVVRARVRSTVCAPVETFELLPRRASRPRPGAEHAWLLRPTPHRYPPPTD
jgi:hypothetical protein